MGPGIALSASGRSRYCDLDDREHITASPTPNGDPQVTVTHRRDVAVAVPQHPSGTCRRDGDVLRDIYCPATCKHWTIDSASLDLSDLHRASRSNWTTGSRQTCKTSVGRGAVVVPPSPKREGREPRPRCVAKPVGSAGSQVSLPRALRFMREVPPLLAQGLTTRPAQGAGTAYSLVSDIRPGTDDG